MNGFWQHFSVSLQLHFRNRTALFYGYLFPLIFLAAFGVLYRHDKIPLLWHMGELLTVSVLGGACFGFPTTLVSERESGVWRRFRLVPLPVSMLLASSVLVRYLIVLSAGALQLGAALAIGMTFPSHPFGLFLAFTCVTFAFIGLGLVIAMLADNVPAVQALGQCVFLPMLIIGGVAVQLPTLPVWAQHVSAFFPGRYAVDALQSSVTGTGPRAAGFDLLALMLIGTTALLAATKCFRWDAHQRFTSLTGKAWLGAVLGACLAVGLFAEWHGQATVVANPPMAVAPAKPAESMRRPPAEWAGITAREVASLNFKVPADGGVVTPFAPPHDKPDDYLREQLVIVQDNLQVWPPANEGNALDRVRACLAACAITDVVQSPLEAYLPQVVLEYLSDTYPKSQLIQILTWIALHSDEGLAVTDGSDLGIDGAFANSNVVRERAHYYAIKFIARLTGRLPHG